MKIAVTGHRPNSLSNEYGYDYNSSKWRETIDIFKMLLTKYKADEAISGMALGADTAFAIAALELKESESDIKLHCAIPCLNHPSKWPKQSQELYNKILEKADEIKIVTEEPYKPYLMQVRNEYMVDRADLIIAFWNGKPGGTGNCVNYARKQYKPIVQVNPNGF